MIVKSFVATLLLSFGFISAVTGSSYSNVYVEREGAPKEFYQYGTPYASIVNPRLSQVNALPPVSSYISPCAPPCVLPGQAIAPSANIITYNAPSLPVIVTPNEDPAGYQYQYVVYDDHTGDHKAQREQSDGSVVRGEYSFLQPDGYIREVQYVADDVSGFNAVVRNFLPVTVEGKKRGETMGHKNSAIHCLEVKNESLKKGSEESEESLENHGSHGHGYSHKTESKKLSNHHSEQLNVESNIKSKHSVTKGSHDSQHHDKHDNKSENESDESASSEEDHHSKAKHESEDVSHETHNKKNKKVSESGEESHEDSEEHTKGKHIAHLKKVSDGTKEESIEKHQKSKKGPHSDESSEESAESSVSEESSEKSKDHSKDKSKSKARKGHKAGHESEHGSSHDSGHGSEHDSGNGSEHVSTHDSGHGFEHGSEHESEHDSGHRSKHGSGHVSEHGSSNDSHGSEHDSAHRSKNASKHGSGHDNEHGSEETGSNEKHKLSHEVDEHQVLVPYNDIVRCVMQALKRSHGLPAGMSQEPSALSYLVLNKPC